MFKIFNYILYAGLKLLSKILYIKLFFFKTAEKYKLWITSSNYGNLL